MNKKMGICSFIVAMIACLAGCGKNDGANLTEATNALMELRNAEMQLSGELYEKETILAFQGDNGALETLDCSSYAEIMEKYDAVLRYTNLHEWMILEGFTVDGVDSYDKDTMTISDEDYKKITDRFYQLDKEEQSKVLRHMFMDTGFENRKVALDFDYVPTGEVTEEGNDISKYEATNEKEISIKLYTSNPLKIEMRY